MAIGKIPYPTPSNSISGWRSKPQRGNLFQPWATPRELCSQPGATPRKVVHKFKRSPELQGGTAVDDEATKIAFTSESKTASNDETRALCFSAIVRVRGFVGIHDEIETHPRMSGQILA